MFFLHVLLALHLHQTRVAAVQCKVFIELVAAVALVNEIGHVDVGQTIQLRFVVVYFIDQQNKPTTHVPIVQSDLG